MNNESRKIVTFTDLYAWQKGHELTLQIYSTTKTFPRDELFGLTSQMRRASVSITSNIAEGFSRKSYKEKINFYYIAHGSLTELQNQLLIARDVGYITEVDYKKINNYSTIVHKIITGLIKKSKSYTS